MLPSPTDLKYFIEVSQTLNLSRAAERLAISQPSLTQAIKRLENQMGISLFFRSKKGMELTPAGKKLVSKTQALFDYWDQVEKSVHSSQNEMTGRFTLGVHPSVATYTLPFFLPQFLSQNPEVEISLRHDLSRKVTEEVISSKIDVGIVVNPISHPDLVIAPICKDVVTFFESKKTKELKNQDVLIHDSHLIQTLDLLKKESRGGSQYRRFIDSSNLEVMAHLALSGAGQVILPTRVAEAVSGKRLLPINGAPQFKDQISVVYRVENKSIFALKSLVKAIKEAF